MHPTLPRLLLVTACLSPAACGGASNPATTMGSSSSSGGAGTGGASTSTTGTGGALPDAGGCALTADTSPTSTASPTGCQLLTRDTSACAAARKAQGLSGFWLEFSCRVTLSATTEGGAKVVKAASDGQPDYESFYFPKSNACYADYPGGTHNPAEIVAKTYVIELPLEPSTTSSPQMGGIVGLALNGVPIFDNAAGPGDDIFKEAISFDRCGGHPQMSGEYHYHSEPYAISYDDARFIGVLRDGYPVYGRKDADGGSPTLDSFGGHTGLTAENPTTPVYHYHVNEQTSSSPMTAGQKQWFLTTGTYRGTPASCGSCM